MLAFDDHINNTKLHYFVNDLITVTANKVTSNPIRTRYKFGGIIVGDYTDVAVGSNSTLFHGI